MDTPLTRRLPVYALLDTSASMAGAAGEAAHQALRALLADLRADPQARDAACVALLSFAGIASPWVPLRPLSRFPEPPLPASRGASALGAALRLLAECVEQDARPGGDWRPLAFLLTDGHATDAWEEPAARLRAQGEVRLVAVATGPQAQLPLLRRVADAVLEADHLTPGSLRRHVKWRPPAGGPS